MNNIPEYLVEHGHADNMFSAAGMANGLKLFGLSDVEIETRAALYRKWRPTHKSAVKPWQAFELVTKAPWLNPDDYPDRQMDLFQPCGHPLTSVVGETTKYCTDCAKEAK